MMDGTSPQLGYCDEPIFSYIRIQNRDLAINQTPTQFTVYTKFWTVPSCKIIFNTKVNEEDAYCSPFFDKNCSINY